jgi:hypothetical protein
MRAWIGAVMLGQHAAGHVFVDLDIQYKRGLPGNSRPAETWVSPLPFHACCDQFNTRLRPRGGYKVCQFHRFEISTLRVIVAWSLSRSLDFVQAQGTTLLHTTRREVLPHDETGHLAAHRRPTDSIQVVAAGAYQSASCGAQKRQEPAHDDRCWKGRCARRTPQEADGSAHDQMCGHAQSRRRHTVV